MRNEVIFDNRGIPDIMVVFTPDELGLPAEIRGKAVKEYAISKYHNTLIGGRALLHALPAARREHQPRRSDPALRGQGARLALNH